MNGGGGADGGRAQRSRDSSQGLQGAPTVLAKPHVCRFPRRPWLVIQVSKGSKRLRTTELVQLCHSEMRKLKSREGTTAPQGFTRWEPKPLPPSWCFSTASRLPSSWQGSVNNNKMLVLPEYRYRSPNKAALYLWPGRPRSDTPQKWTVRWPARLTCDDGAQSQPPTSNPRAPPGDGFWVWRPSEADAGSLTEGRPFRAEPSLLRQHAAS